MPSTVTPKPRRLARASQPPLDRAGHRDVPQEHTLGGGAPSRRLLGALPLTRLVPQDVHSVIDYMNGIVVGAGALMTDDPAARLASIALGASIIGVAAVTNYRLSGAKLIPIEVHEATDYLWGAAAIAAPFVLGYWKRSPRVAMMHVVAGAGTILASMITDYRSAKRGR